jgi:hypothetical protein
MIKTNDHEQGVREIITRARQYNSNIGEYVEHFLNERFSFTVSLTNGRMSISSTKAHDQETMPTSISDYELQQIAKTFLSNTPPPPVNTNQREIELTTWQRILRFLGL